MLKNTQEHGDRHSLRSKGFIYSGGEVVIGHHTRIREGGKVVVVYGDKS